MFKMHVCIYAYRVLLLVLLLLCVAVLPLLQLLLLAAAARLRMPDGNFLFAGSLNLIPVFYFPQFKHDYFFM